MPKDCRGLDLTTHSAAAAAAFDHAIDGFLGYRADLSDRMDAVFALDPDFGMAHCLKGYLLMMAFKAALLPEARVASGAAWRGVARGTARELAHAGALDAWIAGDQDQAAAIWDSILQDHPHDILAFRLVHFVNFWLGRPEAMLASVKSVGRHWDDDLPGYTALLACRCFAHEECGYYAEAEHAGREAIRRDPTDLWAAHGVAHVLEMTGRFGEGIAWVGQLQANWGGIRRCTTWNAATWTPCWRCTTPGSAT
jgi:hypothetical protein